MEQNIKRIRNYHDKKRMLESLPYDYPRPLCKDTRAKQKSSAWQRIKNLSYYLIP